MPNKIAISVVCSVGLHALLLLFWHYQPTQSPYDQIMLESRTDSVSEPVRIVLRPDSQRQTVSEDLANSIRDRLAPSTTKQPPAALPAAEMANSAQSEPDDAIADRGESQATMPEGIFEENLLVTEPAETEGSVSVPMMDRQSIRDQIQRFSPQNQYPDSESTACQQSKRLQGMPVTCRPDRYAALMTEGVSSQSIRTEERLASLLDGPEPVPAASENDLSDPGNRVQANRNLVGDQLQANQIRNAVMNQP